MFARFLIAALLCSALPSIGCVSSIRPLSDEQTSIPDLRLLGTWEISDPEKANEKQTVVVSRKKDSKTVLQAVGQEGEKKETADLFFTKIGKDYIVSILSDEKEKKYTIGKYELVGEKSLKIWALDNEFFTAAITKKELKGTLTKKDFFTDVTLDESQENLRKFIEKYGAKCFGKEMPIAIKRIKGAE